MSRFTARDLNGYADYLTLYYKDASVGETVEQQKVLRNHECGVMRKLSSLRSYFEYLFRMERVPGKCRCRWLPCQSCMKSPFFT